MEQELEPENKPNEKNLPRLNTSSSVALSSGVPEKPTDDYVITQNSNDNHEIHQNKNIQMNGSTFIENKSPEDPDQKYFRLGVLIQFLIVLKILLFSVCLFKIQLLGLAIIFDLLGQLSVCHMVKKVIKVYIVFLCGSFVAKIYGIVKLSENFKDSEFFNLIYGTLISAQLIEAIQGILLIFFAYRVFKMHQSKIDELYDKNCFCCKSKKSK